jgi:hypothetical protein
LRDVRAVENPITEIFNLAEDVEREAPRIRVSIQTARIFIAFALVLNALFIVIVSEAPALALLLTLAVFLLLYIRRWVSGAGARSAFLALAAVAGFLDVLAFRANLIFGLILVPFFFIGLVALGNLREIHDFFDYYALRHRIVKGVRDADPVVRVPEGRDPVERALALLAGQNPEVQSLLRTPGAFAVPATLRGQSGMAYPFDAYVQKRSTGMRGWSGFGSPGYSIFVKAFPSPPAAADLYWMKGAVEDISAATGIPPVRVIAVWRAEGDARLSDEAYEFLTREVVRVPRLGEDFACSLQSVAEGPDGTYDLIPYIPETMSSALPRRAR